MTDYLVSREEKGVQNVQKSRLTSIGRGSRHTSRQCQGNFCREHTKYEATGSGRSIYIFPCELSYFKKTRSIDRLSAKRNGQFHNSPWGSNNYVTPVTPPEHDAVSSCSSRSTSSTVGKPPRSNGDLEIKDAVTDPNFLHAIARYLTGNVVDIRTNKNQVIRGVFGGCHQGVNFSIDKPVMIDHQSQRISKKLQSPLVLHREDIVEIRASNVDKDEVIQNNIPAAETNCVGSGLRTDAEIASDCRSRPNGGDLPDDGIQLEPFYAVGSEPKDLDGLELNGEDGWSAKQMFSKNESLGVSSTYDPSLTEYTTELRKEDTDEYREREARASALAAEIEGCSESRSMAERENADDDEVDDEETRFSAVQRQSSVPCYPYGRGNGRSLHNERPLPHFNTRGGGPPVRGGGRGTSYRNAVESGGVNSGLKSGGPNPAHARGVKEQLVRFSNNFRLTTKSGGPTGGPGQSQGVSSNLPPGNGPPPRKTDPGTLKNAGPRTKRVYNQTPQAGPVSGGAGRSGVKHQEEHYVTGSGEPEITPAEAKNDSAGPRRSSDADKLRRDDSSVGTKGKDAEEKNSNRSPIDTAPKGQPTTPPVSGKRSLTETEVSTASADVGTGAAATPDTDSARETSPNAGDVDKTNERKISAPSEGKAMTVKSSLNADAQPFYPSWHSPTTAPNNIPIQSPPVAPTPTITPHAGAMGMAQARGVVAGPQHPPVHPTMGVPMAPYQVQAPPSIATPLQNQPIQATALQHVQPGHGGHEGPHQAPHGAPTIVFNPRYLPPGHHGHHGAVPGPAYQMQHPMPGAHGPVSQGMAMQHPSASMQAQQSHGRNGNGQPKRQPAVVSVQSNGPPSVVMNRGGNPEAQAAAMTGTPLVAPNPHGAQQVHAANPHGGTYHGQRIDWAPGFNPYGAVSTAQMAQQGAGRDASAAQQGANISNPPTPSSTPQQTPTFITQPTMSLGHGPGAQATYVYPAQQMAQAGPPGPHQPLFPHQNVGSLAHYPHPGQHLAAAASQAIAPNGSAMMAGPPGAVMLYQATLPGHPPQATGVSHQPGQHHPQAHHQAQQQQHVSNQMHMATVLTHPHMYSHPQTHAHMQQQHHQQQTHHQQQQHQAAAAIQHAVMQQTGSLQQFQPSAHAHASHAHAHPHSIPNLTYAQGPSAASYMAQSQHAGHSVPQHAPQ